jgi:uncharacterized membrane protein YphA (DoxX/SURF4 family)
VLAATFLAAGVLKLSQTRQKLTAMGMTWVEDVSPGTLRLLGAVELLAAVGLVVPAALDIAPVLTPLAAVGVVIVMVGAIVVHARRREFNRLPFNVVLLVLAVVVAWGRFGPYSF